MNTLFMIGFSTLLVAPVFAWLAQRHDPRSPRLRWAVAALAFLALFTSWLRIPLYPLYEQAAAEGRTGFMLLGFWLVNKNDPMWPSLGLTLCGALIGLTAGAPAEPGRLRLPIGLGVLLLASGIAGWVFGRPSMSSPQRRHDLAVDHARAGRLHAAGCGLVPLPARWGSPG